MSDLDSILNALIEGIKYIRRSTITNGKILTEVENFPIPIKLKSKNLIVTIEIFRSSDNMSLFIYDVYINIDPNGEMYVETFGHDSIDIDNFAEKIEKAMLYEDDDVDDLVTVFIPRSLKFENFFTDFVMKFYHITQRSYEIRPFVPPIFENDPVGGEN